MRATRLENLQSRIQLRSIPLNMDSVQFLKKITSPKNVLNSRTPGAHAGGRGCACAPAFFLYYYHPPHNFFRNMPPLMGFRFVHGYYGGKLITPPRSSRTRPSRPHTSPHSMASSPRVWLCSLGCKCGVRSLIYKGGVFRFYVVTEQVMVITRGEILNPTATIPVKVRCL